MTTRVLRYVNECEYLSYKKASLCIQFKPEWRHIVYQNICTCIEIHVSRYSYRGCDFPPIFPKVESLSLVLLHIKGTQYEQIRIYAVKIIAVTSQIVVFSFFRDTQMKFESPILNHEVSVWAYDCLMIFLRILTLMLLYKTFRLVFVGIIRYKK